jgi:hypothetical protein
VKTRLVFTSYCRATTDTDAPGADAAATISRFSASGHTFRRTRALVSIIGLDGVDIQDSGSARNLIQAPFLGAMDVFGSADVEGPPVGADAAAFAG